MRRRAESFLPWLVLVGFLLGAVVVNLLLSSAERRGVDALEESIGGEVQAIAASQDQRFQNRPEIITAANMIAVSVRVRKVCQLKAIIFQYSVWG